MKRKGRDGSRASYPFREEGYGEPFLIDISQKRTESVYCTQTSQNQRYDSRVLWKLRIKVWRDVPAAARFKRCPKAKGTVDETDIRQII